MRIFSITGCSKMAAMIFQLTAAARAVRQVDLEDALEQPGPAQPHRAMVRTVRLALGRWRYLRGRLGLLRHHRRRSTACSASSVNAMSRGSATQSSFGMVHHLASTLSAGC